MGLRIHTNVTSLFLINNLKKQTLAASTAAERIASGFRINSAADDPSGLVMANNLRTQYLGLEQAVENASLASGTLSTASDAIAEARTLLDTVRTDLITVLNDPSQAATLQGSVDAALDSIASIAATTRFNGKYLLNGSSGYAVANRNNGANVEIRKAVFGFGATSLAIRASAASRASQATRGLGAAANINGASSITVRITGPLGSRDINVVSATTMANYRTAVNNLRDFTGVYASGGNLFSDDFGSAASVSVTLVTGQSYAGGIASAIGTDFGRDITGVINGQVAQGRGSSLTLNTGNLALTYTFSARTAAGQFDVFSAFSTGGLKFQIGDQPTNNDMLFFGIESIDPGSLGLPPVTLVGGTSGTKSVGGVLSTIRGGGANDLDSNPGNALRIVDAAAKELDALNAFLGSVESQSVDPIVRTLESAINNLKESESLIREADIPAESIKLSTAQILAQASVSVLGQSNFLNNSLVSTLLGFNTVPTI